MSNTTITETGISYGTSDNMKAVLIGIDSRFEISIEKREFEGINKIQAIEEIPTIKITFHQLTDNLITYLADSAMAANGVRFWNKTGLHDGIYQSFYEQDEFKQTATLTLYFCYSLVHEASWEGNLIELGMPRIFPFGRGDLKINSFEFPQNRINAEKSINIDVEKIKFGNKYRYFISSKSSYKITINDLSISGITLEHLAALKNSMVEFTPHIDRPDETYQNLYLSYETKEENNIISAEINLRAISDQADLVFVYAPSIYQSGNFIVMSAAAGAKIYFTYGAASTPPNPVAGNWTEYTSPLETANGYYKAIALLNGKYSGVTEKQIATIIVAKPVLLVVGEKLQMTADTNAEIFYNSNQYTQPAIPDGLSSKYPGSPINLVYAYYKAIAKLNGLWSNVTTEAIGPAFVPTPNVWKFSDSIIKMECSLSGAEIFYTTDGSTPTEFSTKYTQPLPFSYGTYKAIAKLVSTKSAVYEISWASNVVTDFWKYYKFDGNANDEKGVENASLYGSTSYVTGLKGQALQANSGNVNYARITMPTGDYTVIVLMRLTGNNTGQPFAIGNVPRDSFASFAFEITSNNGTTASYRAYMQGAFTVINSNFDIDKFNMITITCVNGSQKMYLNKNLMYSAAERYNRGYLYLGISFTAFLNLKTFENVRIYQRGIQQSEVNEIHDFELALN